ncbi:hypothetical protein [Siccirubricoccus sp. G192]|uniref:hypothetical protein n=1 Tax=Siccirubricoccus sp. G192 TaxID=2849651 RepID=UPI0020C1BEB3|nr:hypothetical protein [Siccirubricoccus sp. G192]
MPPAPAAHRRDRQQRQRQRGQRGTGIEQHRGHRPVERRIRIEQHIEGGEAAQRDAGQIDLPARGFVGIAVQVLGQQHHQQGQAEPRQQRRRTQRGQRQRVIGAGHHRGQGKHRHHPARPGEAAHERRRTAGDAAAEAQ